MHCRPYERHAHRSRQRKGVIRRVRRGVSLLDRGRRRAKNTRMPMPSCHFHTHIRARPILYPRSPLLAFPTRPPVAHHAALFSIPAYVHPRARSPTFARYASVVAVLRPAALTSTPLLQRATPRRFAARRKNAVLAVRASSTRCTAAVNSCITSPFSLCAALSRAAAGSARSRCVGAARQAHPLRHTPFLHGAPHEPPASHALCV